MQASQLEGRQTGGFPAGSSPSHGSDHAWDRGTDEDGKPNPLPLSASLLPMLTRYNVDTCTYKKVCDDVFANKFSGLHFLIAFIVDICATVRKHCITTRDATPPAKVILNNSINNSFHYSFNVSEAS
jgi:hypothetical protein